MSKKNVAQVVTRKQDETREEAMAKPVSTVTVAGQTQELVGKKRRFNPFKGLIRNLVAEHSIEVGRGFMKPEDTVEKEITLADGSKWSVKIARLSGATQRVEPFAFERIRKPRKPRKSE